MISAKNAGGDLKTHYSVVWHWFTAGNVTFNGETKNVLMHMIDMFDSIDMQTAYVRGHIMVDRLQKDFNGRLSVSHFKFFERGAIKKMSQKVERVQKGPPPFGLIRAKNQKV